MKTSHIMCISRILADFTKQIIIKKYFCKSCLQCFSSRNMSTEHKEVCSSITIAHSARLEKGTIEFKNYFKRIAVPSCPTRLTRLGILYFAG